MEEAYREECWCLARVALIAAAGHELWPQRRANRPRSGWNYEIKDGKRVPKSGNRVTKPDGSWREEVKPGQLRDREGTDRVRRV